MYIGLTFTTVNPARSIGPAVVAALRGNAAPIGSLWVFIVAPLVGAAVALSAQGVEGVLNDPAFSLEEREKVRALTALP